MKIKTNLHENTATITLDDGFELILTYNKFQKLKKLISEDEVKNDD